MAVTQSGNLGAPASAVGLGAGLAGPLWLALAIVSALPVFWFGLTGLFAEWARPEFSHGPVIPLLSFYMALREAKAVPPAAGSGPGFDRVSDRWPGFALVALALALALGGNLVAIDDIVFYALIVWVAGLVVAGFGLRRGLVFWPSVLHLVFMLPLPQFLYWEVNTALQGISSEIGVAIVRLAGVPVFLEGNIIDLGVMKLQVAEACSGLRYLFPIMSFSYVFAVLYRGPLWHKLALLGAAVPIAVLMNSVRIGVIGILVDRYGIGQAEGFLHVFEGWVIFLACIGLLFGLAVAMRRLSGEKGRLGEAIDLDFSGLGPGRGGVLGRLRDTEPSRALVAAALLTASLAAAWALAPARAAEPVAREPFALFPRQIAGWAGGTATLDPGIERVLAADDYIAAVFADPAEAAPVDFFLSYYHSQTDGSAIHSPEVCLPGAGWEVFAIEPVAIAGGSSGGGFTANRAVIQKGLERQLVYYWFEGRGRQVSNDFAAKFHTLADGLRTGRSDGGLVRAITPIGPGEAEADADARLRRFLAAALPRLPAHFPQ